MPEVSDVGRGSSTGSPAREEQPHINKSGSKMNSNIWICLTVCLFSGMVWPEFESRSEDAGLIPETGLLHIRPKPSAIIRHVL